MYSGETLCDPAVCKVCTDVCPTKALDIYPSPKPKAVEMGGKRYEYTNINFDKCRICCEGLMRKYGGNDDYLKDDKNATHEEIEAARASIPPDHSAIQPHATWKCGRCQTYCPVGDWGKRFKDTGLTSRLPVFD